jgi:hypothetical protein
VPPIPPLPDLPDPYVKKGWFIHPEVDLKVPVPRDFESEVEDGHLTLSAEDDNKLLSVSVFVSEAVVHKESRGFLYRALERGLRSAAPGISIEVAEDGVRKTSLGRAYYRVWSVRGTRVRSRAEILPICGGTGSIVVTMITGNPAAEEEALAWRERFKRLKDKSLPICQRLDP